MQSDRPALGLIALGRVLFKNRSWIPIPLAISLIRTARPTPRGIAVGVILVAAGLALRLWAVMHIGSRSRTRGTEPPPSRVTTGPYQFTDHPLYMGNGILSEGLVIAGGAGRPWLPVVFPLLWLVQYGPIMLWENSQLSAMKSDGEKGRGTALDRRTNTLRDAMSSERRSHQAVAAFLIASLLSGFIRFFRNKASKS